MLVQETGSTVLGEVVAKAFNYESNFRDFYQEDIK